MKNIYVSIYYLKTLHYIFFSFAVFSLTLGIMLFNYVFAEAVSFIGLSVFYCVFSMLIARFFYKNYKEIAEPFKVIKVYFLPYVSLVLFTVFSVTYMVLFYPSLIALVFSFVFINYYTFFAVMIGFVVSRFKVVSKVFEMYNLYTLGEAKKIAVKYAVFSGVKEYKAGSDQKMDEALDNIWAHKDYPLPYVRMFEVALCEKHIIEINRTLDRMKATKDEKDNDTRRSLERVKEYYHQRIKEIQLKED